MILNILYDILYDIFYVIYIIQNTIYHSGQKHLCRERTVSAYRSQLINERGQEKREEQCLLASSQTHA